MNTADHIDASLTAGAKQVTGNGEMERQRADHRVQIRSREANIVQNTYAELQLKRVPHSWPHLF